jgi:hypothetical protein
MAGMQFHRIACAFVLALGLPLGLAGCASSSYEEYAEYAPPPAPAARPSAAPPPASNALPRMAGSNHVETVPGQAALQCVPYAREHSVIKIQGDANTWWDKAAGKYERGGSPAIGAVMVLHNYSASQTGHVAVVKRVVSEREIRIDHANWLNDGSIYVNNPVRDVSANNDWSQVRIYNIQTGGWGTKVYPVQGFIGSGSNNAPLAPKAAPPVAAPAPKDEDDTAPSGLTPETEALIAQLLQQPPASAPVAAPATPTRAVARPAASRAVGMMPVSAGPSDFNPPAGSAFALTAEDLAIP